MFFNEGCAKILAISEYIAISEDANSPFGPKISLTT